MYQFDLEKSITGWRRHLKAGRTFLPEDLDELESHLRDHFDRLAEEGVEPRAAFRQALDRLGPLGELDDEYRKVRRGRSKRIQSLRQDSALTLALVRNYLRIASRNLRRHAMLAGLNVTGLAVGLASCLLILLFVSDELQYDGFQTRADELYRVNWDFSWNGRDGIGSGTPPPLAAALVETIPGVESATRIYPVADMVVRAEDRFFTESNIFGVDSTFFDLFSFEIVAGNPLASLAAPGNAILTKSTARKYFGDTSPLGRAIRIGEDAVDFGQPYRSEFRVTGVVADPPARSHFQFDILTSMPSHPRVERFDWSWIWMQVVTYVTVPDAADVPEVEARIRELVAERAPPAFQRVGFSFDELIEAGGHWGFVLQPLLDIYLGSDQIGNRIGPTGSERNLYIFSLVAAFILGIACINAMNLATARSSTRANEVGVRKVMGSDRTGLMAQFLIESLLFSAVATVLAVGLAALMIGPFNRIAGKALSLTLLSPPWLPFALVAAVVLVGLLAGSYPAFYLSSFRPIQVLKGSVSMGRNGRRMRNGLVVMQFSISIALIVCTLFVRSQMALFQDADMGFERENVLVITNDNQRLGESAEAFADALASRSWADRVSLANGVPTEWWFQDYYKAEDNGDEQFELSSYLVDDAYVSTLGLDMASGRDFRADSQGESRSVLLNQAAVALFGWESPIGKKITYPGVGDFEVIGVVQDFNFESLEVPILPFALFHQSSESYRVANANVVVRLRPGTLDLALAEAPQIWEEFAPAAPFEYTFLDDAINRQYLNERRLQTLLLIFAGLAILVACLGLWGLAAFVAEKRTKEIGIRKSLGASVPSVLVLLLRDFTKWVVVANLIAWPAAYLWARDWLDTFAFRVEVGPMPFVVAGLGALLVAILTVGYQATRTARANPVESLRYE